MTVREFRKELAKFDQDAVFDIHVIDTKWDCIYSGLPKIISTIETNEKNNPYNVCTALLISPVI